MPNPADYARHDHPAFAERLLGERFTVVGELAIEAWTSAEPLPFARRQEGAHVVLRVGERWADLFGCAWFRFTGTLPAGTDAAQAVLLIDVNGELLVVDAAGLPVRGLTNQASVFDRSHGLPGKTVLPLSDLGLRGPDIALWADGGANDLFGALQGEGRIAKAAIAVCRLGVAELAYDVEVLADLAKALPEGEGRRQRIEAALNACQRTWSGPAAAPACRALLAPLLAERGGDRTPALSAIGHAHLDLGWLWPVRESRRKAVRTLATVLRNLERHPNYVFGISQPQQLAWVREEQPALFEQVRRMVAAGRIECQGGMWVESDTNLVSGESLVRQMLHGQRAWKQWFGVQARGCWLPDVFGYSAALPQILTQAGIDWFMTIKLSWSRVNRFPHHTFRWQSPDGSEVLAHMPPEGTYNSCALPRAAISAAKNFQDAARSDRALLVYGIGDGGGGPGEEHLERLERCRDLAGMPAVEMESAERFFTRIEERRAAQAAWSGELYLEFHQGTFTSQARMKRANRRLEWALRRAELAASRAWLAGAAWPGERLDRLWKDVLLHQFHDILPGSSIGRVYADAEARSAAMLDEVAALVRESDAALPAGAQVVNDLSWTRRGWVQSPAGWHRVEVPPCAAVALPAPSLAGGITATTSQLDNGLLRARFDAGGRLVSLLDLASSREALSAPGDDLICFDDPGDAWDFPIDYLQRRSWRPEQAAIRAGVDGPEAWIERTLRTGASTIVQRIVLADGARRLEFRCRVDWQERGVMLRVRFPVAVHAEHARCEIAIGSIARPTHANTSWDAARYEVPAHSWVDLSERSHGVALLNDGKYGHRLEGDVLDLALLRSPSYPDPQADRGEQVFTYAILPHAGDHAVGRVTEEAHDLNEPLRLAAGGGGRAALPLLVVEGEGVHITAVKRAEDADLLVVRLMETHGATTAVRLRSAAPVLAAHAGNLLEEPGAALAVADGAVQVAMGPWSLRTVLLRVQR